MNKHIAIIALMVTLNNNPMQQDGPRAGLADGLGSMPTSSVIKSEKISVPYTLPALTALLEGEGKARILQDDAFIYVTFNGKQNKYPYCGTVRSLCIKDDHLIIVTKEMIKIVNLVADEIIKHFECHGHYNKFVAISNDFNHMLVKDCKKKHMVLLVDNEMAAKALTYVMLSHNAKQFYVLPEDSTVVNGCALFNDDSTRIAIKAVNPKTQIICWYIYNIAEKMPLFKIDTDGPINFIDNALITDGNGQNYDYTTGQLIDGLSARLALTQHDISA